MKKIENKSTNSTHNKTKNITNNIKIMVKRDNVDDCIEFNYWNVPTNTHTLTIAFVTISLMMLMLAFGSDSKIEEYFTEKLDFLSNNMFKVIEHDGFCSGATK